MRHGWKVGHVTNFQDLALILKVLSTGNLHWIIESTPCLFIQQIIYTFCRGATKIPFAEKDLYTEWLSRHPSQHFNYSLYNLLTWFREKATGRNPSLVQLKMSKVRVDVQKNHIPHPNHFHGTPSLLAAIKRIDTVSRKSYITLCVF